MLWSDLGKYQHSR